MGVLSKLDASDNSMFGKGDKAGITAWADALKANTSITELNLAKNGITANDTKILAPAISDNGALLHLDVSDNNLGKSVPPEGWTKGTYISGGKYHWSHTDGRNEEGMIPFGSTPDGVIALADAILGMGAMTWLDISENNLRDAGTEALAGGLEGNQIMTEINISSNYISEPGAIALANIIPGMGALSILNMSKNDMKGAEAGKALGDALATNAVLKELDLSGANARPNVDVAFVKAFAPGLSDNGALTKLAFGDKQVVTMTTEMTEANFGGKLMSYEAQIVAAFLPKCM
jgi:hypothetical protein